MHSGKQSPAYFGTIPRTWFFLGVLISLEEKNNLKAKRGKKPLRQEDKRRDQKRKKE